MILIGLAFTAFAVVATLLLMLSVATFFPKRWERIELSLFGPRAHQ